MQILRPRLLSLSLGLQVLGPHSLPPPLPIIPTLFLISTYNLASVSRPFSSLLLPSSPSSPPSMAILPHPPTKMTLCCHPPSSFDEDDLMLAGLHSFVSSLSLPPLASSTALEQHQQPREKNSISIWVLQIESNHRIMVYIDHIAK
ncbi:hypothetical protein AAC387_Pa04g1887 [Persea americana]